MMKVSNRPGAMPGFWRNYWSRNRITIFLGVVTCIFLADSLQLGRASAWVPRSILLTTLSLIVLLLGRELRGQSAGAGVTAIPDTKGIVSIVPALGWIGAMLMMVWLLGVSMGLMLFCFGYLRWYANESWSMSGVLACSLGLFIQGVFGLLFKMPLYQGVLSALT